MSMSIGGIGAYNMYQAKPMNYALSNQAPVSDVYDKHKAVGDIATVAPVVYPNAQQVKVGEVASTDGKDDSLKATLQASQQYNQIASKFGTETVGYNRNMSGYSYGQSGGSFDAFA